MTLAVALLVVGLLLVVAELCFPTVGLLGLLATLFILGGIGAAFAHDTRTGMIFLAATAVLVPVMVVMVRMVVVSLGHGAMNVGKPGLHSPPSRIILSCVTRQLRSGT